MKKTRIRDIAITAILTAIICLSIGLLVTDMHNPSIGDTVAESSKVESTSSESSEAIDEREEKHTYVYLGATSKLYYAEDSMESTGIFLELFNYVDLAEVIDTEGFPYKMEYFATTSSTKEVRYLIKTESGSSYWVEP